MLPAFDHVCVIPSLAAHKARQSARSPSKGDHLADTASFLPQSQSCINNTRCNEQGEMVDGLRRQTDESLSHPSFTRTPSTILRTYDSDSKKNKKIKKERERERKRRAYEVGTFRCEPVWPSSMHGGRMISGRRYFGSPLQVKSSQVKKKKK